MHILFPQGARVHASPSRACHAGARAVVAEGLDAIPTAAARAGGVVGAGRGLLQTSRSVILPMTRKRRPKRSGHSMLYSAEMLRSFNTQDKPSTTPSRSEHRIGKPLGSATSFVQFRESTSGTPPRSTFSCTRDGTARRFNQRRPFGRRRRRSDLELALSLRLRRYLRGPIYSRIFCESFLLEQLMKGPSFTFVTTDLLSHLVRNVYLSVIYAKRRSRARSKRDARNHPEKQGKPGRCLNSQQPAGPSRSRKAAAESPARKGSPQEAHIGEPQCFI